MTAKELVDPNYPSPFYALFEGAVDVSLRFPVGPDGGPLWDDEGAIKSSHCPDVTDEDVSVVDLASAMTILLQVSCIHSMGAGKP